MFVIDTNVFIFDTFEDSEYYKEAKDILDNLNVWIVPDIVILEYVWFVKEFISPKDILLKVEEYFLTKRARIVKTNIFDYIFSLKTIIKEKISVSRFNDKIILSVAKRFGGLASFDRKLRNQAKRISLKVIPESL